MNFKKIIKITFISFVIVLILAASVFYFSSRELFNCLTIGESYEFIERGSNIYISKDTPKKLQDSIIFILKETDKRVCAFLNTDKLTKNPVRIFCYSNSLLSDYGGSNLILTYKTPINSFIVFSKDRIDPDMLSHELLHAEFCSRTGYFKNKNIPVWFDEGLAMLVDYRKEYSEEKYSELKDSVETKIKLSELAAPEKFYSGNHYVHFLAARHEVYSWYNHVKIEGLKDLINRTANGENFYLVYRELVDKYSR
jgi:hypothetical protein